MRIFLQSRWAAALLWAGLLLCAATGAQAGENAGRCHLPRFLKQIGYHGVMSADEGLVTLDASLGDEARCTYEVRFAPCIDKALERFNAAARLRPASRRAKGAIVRLNIARAIMEHGVALSYTVRKAGFFSSPKFSDIEASETFFGVPIKGGGGLFDDKTIGGWKYLCRLGTVSEAAFLKELGADDAADAGK